MAKDVFEIAGDITMAWMQAVAPRGNIDVVLETLSSDSICDFYSAVCETILQCKDNARRPKVQNKPKNW